MSAGRIIAAVAGAVLGLIAIGLLVAGGALTIAHAFGRDAEGFLTSPDHLLDSDSYAFLADDLELWADDPADAWLGWLGDELTIRLTAVPANGEVFIGIGPRGDVADYLAGVGHTRLVEMRPGSVRVEEEPGGAPATAPTEQDFWVASRSGSGTQQLEWDATSGEWAAVLMRPDGSADVAAIVSGAVAFDALLPIAIGLLLLGLVLLGAALAVLLFTRERAAGAPVPVAEVAGAVGPYPLRLEAQLDEPLSRWLWLVKWFLAIPHVIVLGFLWVAVVLTTIVAGVAILFTGRYPRSIFDFNVGVLRWTWRVQHYATGTIGTDRYPPFSLREETYPAHLDVVYPDRLSRGLVLVKWWLLALPHLLIVGFFTGGLLRWTVPLEDGTGAQLVLGGGLISVLVVVAGVVLLFRGSYPRGLFDLLMGLNRWVYRVGAYCLLLTDEYPPFRLDSGGSEPPVGPTSPGDTPTTGQQRLIGV